MGGEGSTEDWNEGRFHDVDVLVFRVGRGVVVRRSDFDG